MTAPPPDISLHTLFDSPTVAGIAAAIAQQQAGGAETEQLDRMVAELEEMPDDEIERLLLEEGGRIGESRAARR